MEPESLRKRLDAGEVLLGLCNCYPLAAIIEAIGRDWDFIWIDGQHGQFSYDSVLNVVRAADLVRTHTLLRVPTHDPGILGLYADTAPSAILVPLVNTAEEAAAVASALRFAPLGNRSFGGRRPIDLYTRDYYQTHQPVLIVQIETPQALDNAEEIVATDGVDGLLFGPDDMRIKKGIPINSPVFETPALLEAMVQVGKVARKAGKYAGCIVAGGDAARRVVDMGYQLVIGGADKGFLQASSQTQSKALRQALGSKAAATTAKKPKATPDKSQGHY
ncbi:MAG: aldolase/citrate lyase family protein [Phycisphaerae bacterium]|jgi:2-keto-3-deoxy-L-rhamnonate aldolase RhmA|nr:aldolase/citrate lyase family protein [Phycisphaerae bacterium]